MRVFLPLMFAATVLAWGLPVAVGAIAGLVVGHEIGRAKQRRVHAFAVWKGHPR